jgi:hypothetical protein
MEIAPTIKAYWEYEQQNLLHLRKDKKLPSFLMISQLKRSLTHKQRPTLLTALVVSTPREKFYSIRQNI